MEQLATKGGSTWLSNTGDLAFPSGHSVTAFVRSPQKLPKDRPGLTVVQGSPADVPALAQAMAGHDAVFSTLAPRGREVLSAPAKRDWTMAGYATNIVRAMEQAGVKRLLAFGSAWLFPGQSLFVRMLSFPARHHVAPGALPEGCKAMHFRGLARFMVDAAADGSHRGELLGIGR